MLFNTLGDDGGLFVVIGKKNKINMNLEFNLVKFPLIFPLIYGAILYFFPNYEIYLIFFTILILAETHFAATWPFFVNSSNINFIKENKISLISFPILICIFLFLVLFLSNQLFF